MNRQPTQFEELSEALGYKLRALEEARNDEQSAELELADAREARRVADNELVDAREQLFEAFPDLRPLPAIHVTEHGPLAEETFSPRRANGDDTPPEDLADEVGLSDDSLDFVKH